TRPDDHITVVADPGRDSTGRSVEPFTAGSGTRWVTWSIPWNVPDTCGRIPRGPPDHPRRGTATERDRVSQVEWHAHHANAAGVARTCVRHAEQRVHHGCDPVQGVHVRPPSVRRNRR